MTNFPNEKREVQTKMTSWKSSQSTDKTIQTVTVSQYNTVSYGAVCATGQLLHWWLTVAPGVNQALLCLLP